MRVRLTLEAYEQYLKHTRETVDWAEAERRFQEEMDLGAVMYVKLYGRPAVFLKDAYWLYSVEEGDLVLETCIARIQRMPRTARIYA